MDLVTTQKSQHAARLCTILLYTNSLSLAVKYNRTVKMHGLWYAKNEQYLPYLVVPHISQRLPPALTYVQAGQAQSAFIPSSLS